MLGHRFAELVSIWDETAEPAASVPMASDSVAFLPCSLAVLAGPQAAFVLEVYRLAAERTREQLQPRRALRIPAFSRN